MNYLKYPVSFTFLLLTILGGKAQTAAPLAQLSTVTITLKNTGDGPFHPGFFNHFEVIDERPDTTRIGIHNFVPTLGHTRNKQLVFNQSAAQEIAGYLNTHYTKPGAPYSALIVLRGLWLFDATYLREDKISNPKIFEERTHIRLKAEIYAFNDSFYLPLLRYDTVQTYKRGNPYNNISSYYSLWAKDLSAVLVNMTDSAAGLSLLKGKRHLQKEEIGEFNRSRFDAAITDNPSLTPGVYAGFEEFRNNTPSIPHFEIRREGADQVLYIQEAAGSYYYSHEAWGYCDGKTSYIMRDGKLYPLWKEGKTFYFYSLAYPHLHTIDMDSGVVY